MRGRRGGAASGFSDSVLCDLLITRAEKLSETELAEITQLASGLASGQVDGLARGTRDRLMGVAQRVGALIKENRPMSYEAWKDSTEADRSKTEGELVAAVVLENRPKTPPGRRTAT